MPLHDAVNVFDVSQTGGRELPSVSSFVKDIQGNVDDLVNCCEALAAASPAPISFDEIKNIRWSMPLLDDEELRDFARATIKKL